MAIFKLSALDRFTSLGLPLKDTLSGNRATYSCVRAGDADDCLEAEKKRRREREKEREGRREREGGTEQATENRPYIV